VFRADGDGSAIDLVFEDIEGGLSNDSAGQCSRFVAFDTVWCICNRSFVLIAYFFLPKQRILGLGEPGFWGYVIMNLDKISASTISREYEHLSIDLIHACLFGVPAVSGYSLFQSDMSTKPEIQEVLSEFHVCSSQSCNEANFSSQKSGVVDKARAIGSAWAQLAGSSERWDLVI
jgi:hypothetical protein